MGGVVHLGSIVLAFETISDGRMEDRGRAPRVARRIGFGEPFAPRHSLHAIQSDEVEGMNKRPELN